MKREFTQWRVRRQSSLEQREQEQDPVADRRIVISSKTMIRVAGFQDLDSKTGEESKEEDKNHKSFLNGETNGFQQNGGILKLAFVIAPSVNSVKNGLGMAQK